MEALYERVLAHLPTSLRHKSYNAVLREEFASVYHALSDVVVAYTKLEEVQDAVTKLQQSHDSSTSSSSEGLKTSADNTMKLQRRLQRVMEKLVGMHVPQQERKRKRVEKKATVANVLNSGGDNKIVARKSSDIEAKQPKRLEDVVDSGSSPASLENEVKRSTNKSKNDEKVENEEREAAAASGLYYSFGPERNDDSDDDESGSEVEGSEAAWATLMSKGNLSPSPEVKSEPAPAVAAQTTETDNSATTQLKNSPAHQKMVGVKSEPPPAVHVEKPEKDNSATTQLLKKSATYWKSIVEQLDKRSPLNRLLIIPEVLTALKESVEADVDGSQHSEVACTLKILVGWWTRNREYEAQYAELYLEYVALVRAYTTRLPNSAQKDDLKRQTETLSSMIEAFDGLILPEKKMATLVAAIQEAKKKNAITTAIGRPDSVTGEKRIARLLGLLIAFKKETTGNVRISFDKRLIEMISKLSRWLTRDLHAPLYLALYRMIVGALREFLIQSPEIPTRNPALELLEQMSDAISDSPRYKERMAKIRNRAVQLVEEIKQYRGKSLHSEEANQLTSALRVIVEDATIGWSPQRESTMLHCVEEFVSVLEAQDMIDIDAWTTCQICLRAVRKWKTGKQVE